MIRRISYLISPDEEGLSIARILRARRYSNQCLTELKKYPDSTLLDGHSHRLIDAARAGQTLTVEIREDTASDHVLAVPHPFGIVYEDEDLLVVEKPAGLPMHPSKENQTHSLANAVVAYYQKRGQAFTFRCTNRLDTDTSGLTVIGKHFVSAAILASLVKSVEITREYRALACGWVQPPTGGIAAPLLRCPGPLIKQRVDLENGLPSVTHYRVLEHRAGGTTPHSSCAGDLCTENGHSLVALLLETGRTHQIRAHMQFLGYPLAGDPIYNPGDCSYPRTALHAYRLAFAHPMTGEWLEFISPGYFSQASQKGTGTRRACT